MLAIAVAMQAALSRCALTIAYGVDTTPLTNAHAPTPALLSPPQSFIHSEKYIEVIAFAMAPLDHPALFSNF
jgi:hypothetical protein